jgi:hypothetical protein
MADLKMARRFAHIDEKEIEKLKIKETAATTKSLFNVSS